MDARWFKEDRSHEDPQEVLKQKAESEKALRNSTFIVSRLKRILNEDVEKTLSVEENFEDAAWERKVIAAAAERKTLKRIINLLP